MGWGVKKGSSKNDKGARVAIANQENCRMEGLRGGRNNGEEEEGLNEGRERIGLRVPK